MPRNVSVSEAKNQFSALLNWVVEQGDEVIIASRGKPKAALVSYAAYQRFVALREQAAIEQYSNKQSNKR